MPIWPCSFSALPSQSWRPKSICSEKSILIGKALFRGRTVQNRIVWCEYWFERCVFHDKVSDRFKQRAWSKTCKFWITRVEYSSAIVSSAEGKKELNDFQRNLLDIEILSNLRFGSLEIRDTSVTRVTNNSWQRPNLSVPYRSQNINCVLNHFEDVFQCFICKMFWTFWKMFSFRTSYELKLL